MRSFASVMTGLSLAGILGACAHKAPDLPVVPNVDLARYMGTWFEVAKYPNRFQKGCDGASAEYSMRADGRVTVINRCVRPDGSPKSIEGKAWVVDPATNAKLKVRFFWPFSGDYWIIDLGTDYGYAVVSEPSRKYLWILARKPEMEKKVLEGILERLRANGFDTTRLTYSSSRTSR
jgi:apolipoprotein D and lipocalin family protein